MQHLGKWINLQSFFWKIKDILQMTYFLHVYVQGESLQYMTWLTGPDFKARLLKENGNLPLMYSVYPA